MRGKRLWMLGLLALGAASCRSSDRPAARDQAPAAQAEVPGQAPAPAPAPAQAQTPRAAQPAPSFADIAPGLDALRARFQEDDGKVRVIMLVAPT